MAEGHVRAEAAVAELVAELRDGGFIERGRILARGARLLRALTPKQRRTVAIEVARQAAPQLVERITDEGGAAGDVDLTPAQIKAVFDMVARLDDEGAGTLAERLRDPDWQREALGLLATDGVDAVAESAGYDEVGELLSLEEYEQAEAARRTADPTDGTDGNDAADDDFDEGEVLATAAWDPEAGDGIDADLDDAAAEARRLQAEAEALAGDDVEPTPPSAYEPTMPDLATYEPTGVDPSMLRFDTVERPDDEAGAEDDEGHEGDRRSATRDAHERSWFGGGDLGIAPLAAQETPLSQRLLQQARPSQRLRLATREATTIARMDLDEQVGVVLALPDGWVRRRVLHRILDAQGISQAGAGRLLRTLGRDTDRAWVAASMLEDGIVELADVEPLLGDRAYDRLAARYGGA